MHSRYSNARAMLPENAAVWVDAVKRHVSSQPNHVVLDLGCGTGRFSLLLAETLAAQVIGVEPSVKMREQAGELVDDPRVRFLDGSAERIPLEDASCSVVWMSMVVHHIGDLAAAADEIHRVLEGGGTLLLRNSYSGRLDGIHFYEYFPSALTADEARLPRFDVVRRAPEQAGLVYQQLEALEQRVDRTFATTWRGSASAESPRSI